MRHHGRLSLPAGGPTIHSLFDADGNRIAEYDQTSGALIREYVWFDGAVIEGGVVYYSHSDHIDRPVFATNGAGLQVWTASYLPFGGVRTSTGTPITARFPGQWFQTENGLHQNWMRDYDPTTGRYVEADPLGLIDGASVYGYVKGNPGRWIDPRGEEALSLPGVPGSSIGPIMSVAPGTPLGDRLGRSLLNDIFPLLDPRPFFNFCADSIFTPMADGTLQCGEQCSPNNSDTPDPPFPYPIGWDGKTKPAPGWTWKGPDQPGGRGNWVSPDGKTSVRGDPSHLPPIGPHIDLARKGRKPSRWFPDGTVKPKR